MKIAKDWIDYEIIDMKDGNKVERWGKYILKRPDPQIVWSNNDNKNIVHSMINTFGNQNSNNSKNGRKVVVK